MLLGVEKRIAPGYRLPLTGERREGPQGAEGQSGSGGGIMKIGLATGWIRGSEYSSCGMCT
jgi:hypothetical protein